MWVRDETSKFKETSCTDYCMVHVQLKKDLEEGNQYLSPINDSFMLNK